MSAIYECECDSFEMMEDQDAFSMNEGIPGPGVPAGGSAGQILQKRSQEDYDTEWVTPDGYVPAGGSAGQILKKSSAADYDTEWDSLDAGDVSFDSSLTYAAGSVGKEICDVKNTLSHKADVIYDTAGGDIASFPDGADGLPVKDLTVGIEPVQDLHGYDSPWPAGGGKNLIDQSLTYQDGNNTTTFGQSVNNTDPQIFLKAGNYTLHVVTNKECSIYYRKGAGGGNTHLIHAGTDLVGTFTLDSDTYCAFWCYINNGFTASNIISVQLEAGSTATTYAPYSNICPISGWTGANVVRTNSNLIDKSLCEIGNFNGSTGLPVDATNRIRFNGIIVKPGKYTLSAESPWQVMPIIYELDGTFIGSVDGGNLRWYTSPFTFTLNKAYILKAVFRKGSTNPDVTLPELESPMLNFGSTALTYEPGSTTDVTINFGSTVYGGTLDVTSGVLTVEKVKLAFDGSEDENWTRWSASASNFNFFYISEPDIAPNSETSLTYISNELRNVYITSSNNNVGFYFTPSNNRMRLRYAVDNTLTTADLRQWLSNNPLEVVCDLAQPLVIQLDPVTMTTLLGTNNIWADCGPSTVEYPCDTKLYIERLTAPEEDDMIADANIASGKYFIVNNNLYLSTAAILAGDPIKPGTNCTLTNLAAALNAINS